MPRCDPAELQAFRERHPAIEAVQLLITDPSGVPRGKSVRVHELERLYRSGRHVAGSILGLDVTGVDVEATGLVWQSGDADLVCHPGARHAAAVAVARAADRAADARDAP